jgi:hypothetical protein
MALALAVAAQHTRPTPQKIVPCARPPKGHNLSILRRCALSLCKQEKTAKVGIKIEGNRAGLNNDYLLNLLNLA